MTLISIYIASRLTKPINKLATAANHYANRIFTPVEIKGSDEISLLSRSFNAMGINSRITSKGKSNSYPMCPMSSEPH